MAVVTMPALSPTMTEGKLAKWLVAEGDEVRSGDVIAEIETDKALMEVEALDDGIVAKLVVAEGTEQVKVGAAIAEIQVEGESPAGAQEQAEGKETRQEQKAPQEQELPEQELREEREEFVASSKPAPSKPASGEPAPSGSASGGSPPLAERASATSAPVSGEARIFASPLARRLAAGKGIDLAAVTGSGPHGRIIKADIEALGERPDMMAPVALAAGEEGERSSLIKVSPTRKVIAERLHQSMQEAPHFYINMDIELDALLAARKSINDNLDNTDPDDNKRKITVNDMLIKCAAATLMRVPAVNASWEGDFIRRHHHADIAVAVALEGGLLTPIIPSAERKSLTQVSAEMASLAERARAGKLKPTEFTGGSFTISNLGMYGVSSFTAVINPPHGAILAIAAGRPLPVVRDGAVTVATVMTATLSCDHRVIDGAVGAEWMAAFKKIVENPMLALV